MLNWRCDLPGDLVLRWRDRGSPPGSYSIAWSQVAAASLKLLCRDNRCDDRPQLDA